LFRNPELIHKLYELYNSTPNQNIDLFCTKVASTLVKQQGDFEIFDLLNFNFDYFVEKVKILTI